MQSEKDNLESFGLKVADHVSAMLAYWDKDLVCRFANAAYMDWFGKTRTEMVDKMTIRELLGPLYEKNLPYILRALEGKVQTFERDILTPSGETRHSIANYFPDIANGEVKGFFVHVADITQVKLLEGELVRSYELIKEQNKRLLSFSNIVSHNLRSYASNLKIILDLLLKADDEKEKQTMLDHLQTISKGFSSTIEHLNKIVEVQNLDSLAFEQINLHRYIEQTLKILSMQIKSVNAIIRNNVSPELMLTANPAYTESITLNLLTNALKYRHHGRTPVIELDSLIKGNELELRIRDNGLGIDLEKHRNNIFGMYQTFHSTADARGIGLFITKLQVEAMGGRIDLESEEGKGSTFILHLPYRGK